MGIMFLEDWKKFPNAMVHRTTTNTSFLKQAEKYKMKKVKNYFFILALLQPELEFVNPHDPDLDHDTKAKIVLECLHNPWYFLREVARVPPQGGTRPSIFRANRGNIALWWSFFVHADPFLIQPRQTGKSLSVDMLISYLLYIAANNSRINLLTKDNALRVSNVERLKEIRDYLPDYIQLRHKKDSDNTIEVDCFLRNNTLSTAVAQASKSGAYNIGRGMTAPLAVIDEGPYCDNIETTLAVMLMSGNAARDEAKAFGMPYGTIFTTTAGPRNTASGRYMYELCHNGFDWTEALFDLKDEHAVKHLIETSIPPDAKPVINITMSHRQLGYTDEWMFQKIREANARGESADRDLFNKWTDGDTVAPLSGELLERIIASLKEPEHIEISPDGYMTKWYIPYDQIEQTMLSNTVIMGVDMSEAVGRDYITLVLCDEQTLDVYAVSSVNETNLIRYTDWVCNLMLRYPSIVMIPECKSAGRSLIDNLLIQLPIHGIDPFKRIYNVIVDEQEKFKNEYKEMLYNFHRRDNGYYDRMKKYFGFNTSGSGKFSRENLYDVLQHAARLAGDKCYDKKLIGEIAGLEIKNNRIDHAQGGHDDTVISWLLIVWMLTQSKNLAFYGINKPLRKAKEYRSGAPEKKALTIEELYEEEQQEWMRHEIDTLLEKLHAEKDEFMIRRIEFRLRSYEGRIDGGITGALSIDELIKEAAQQRQQGMRMKQRQRDHRAFTYG